MAAYLVTGVAGFIGSHLAERLLAAGENVVGVDNLNDYYSVQLKHDRLARLASQNFEFLQLDLANREGTAALFSAHKFDVVLHMAAQAGVRYSLTNPHAYVDSNVTAFLNILEGCRHAQLRHLVYASSSSVYGANRNTPFAVGDAVDHPINLYAATKRANELMAFSYSHLFGIPTTGLRFFTVYGPWGRPDMAIYRFAEAIVRGEPINVFNSGQMSRDFTYVDDIVEGVLRIAEQPPTACPESAAGNPTQGHPQTPAVIYNIGNNRPVELEHLIAVLESELGVKAVRNNCPMQPGDMATTYADVEPLEQAVGFRPSTSIETGIRRFVEWFQEYRATEKRPDSHAR
jgi:UDP-glucuronate 4-epimerase